MLKIKRITGILSTKIQKFQKCFENISENENILCNMDFYIVFKIRYLFTFDCSASYGVFFKSALRHKAKCLIFVFGSFLNLFIIFIFF